MDNSTTTLSALTLDSKNANKGTARGLDMLRASLEKHGAGRSIVLDRDGRIIAGNKTAQAAALAGLDDVIVVKTDGRKIVAVQRMDLDLDSPEGRQLALADNRVGEVSLRWDTDILVGLQGGGLDLSDLFTGGEIDALLGELSAAPDLASLTGGAGPGGQGIGVPAGPTPAGSEQGPFAAPAPGKASAGVPAPRPLGPQGPPATPVPPRIQAGQAAAESPAVQFKEFDESVAAGLRVHQCPACGNRWAE